MTTSTRGGTSALLATFLLLGCGGNYSGAPVASDGAAGSSGGNVIGGGSSYTTPQAYFTAQVEPNIGFCRTCHIPGGVADTAGTSAATQGNLFLLSSDSSQDYANLMTAWTNLGKGVAANKLLTNPSDPAQGHTGGQPWPSGSQPFTAMQTLLNCWDNPSGCAALLSGAGSSSGGPVVQQYPLLGSSHGGHLWDDYCANDGSPLPDSATLPQDPRSLIQPGVNAGKAVYFNAYWQSCHPASNPVSDQAPKTCGDWRARVASGAILEEGNGAIGAGTILAGNASAANALLAMPNSTYNTLWQAWGLASRPANFDQLVAQRYGFALSNQSNPYPLAGENPNASNGGSGQLPMAFTQLRNADESWSGKIGFSSCNACHSARIDTPAGTPQIGAMYGSSNGLGDLAVFLRDLGKGAEGLVPLELNRTRGTGNITQFQIFEALTLLGGDPNEAGALLSFLSNNFAASTGTEDPPTWWNLGHRPLKFYDGGEAADGARIELSASFPLTDTSQIGNLKSAEAWIQAHEMDADAWLLSQKAPQWPYGYCSNADGSPAAGDNPACINTPLAQQGAILFHSKNLWASSLNNPVPQPDGGNGSCAGCHGAYSPQFVNNSSYLDNPAMAGIAGYVVPENVINTDPQRLNGNNQSVSRAMDDSWFMFPDIPGGSCGDQNLASVAGSRKPGYLAPPLYGVWASAPYLHNGSIPSVWEVLKPADRPQIWERVSAPAAAGQSNVVMGYDTDFARAYDTQNLGWDYTTLTCGAVGLTPYLDCNPGDPDADPLLQKLLNGLYSNLALSWNLVNLPILTNQQIENRKIYNTLMYSQGNQGHEFTSVLTDTERKALIEYLKTL